MDAKTKYRLQAHGHKVRVIENATDIIIRTLDDRAQALAFVTELDPPKKEKK